MHEQLPFTDVRKSDSKLAWAAPIYICEQKGWRDDEKLGKWELKMILERG